MNEEKPRLVYIDIVRIISCLFVLYLHTGNEGAYYYYLGITDKIWEFVVYSFFSILCRTAVPLYFCISGILLLGREESIRTIFMKRFLRILVLLSLSSMFYYIRSINYHMEFFSFLDFVKILYSRQVIEPLWFLYAYMAFLLAIPFLKKFVNNGFSENDFKYMISLVVLLCGLFPSIEMFFTGKAYILNQNLSVLTINYEATWCFIFPVVGYVLHTNTFFSRNGFRNLLIACVFGIITTQLLLYELSIRPGEINRNIVDHTLSNFGILYVIFIIAFLKKIIDRINISQRTNKVISMLSRDTLGVYLLHVWVKNSAPFQSLIKTMINSGISVLISSWVFIIAVFGTCVVITELLRRLTVLNRIL